jgi:hypothetical protein
MVRAGLLAALLAIPLWLASGQSALACSGFDVPLADGIRDASSIYFARIISDRGGGDGFYSLTLDVGSVVQGEAPSRVTHVVGAKACAGLPHGASGLVVLGSVNPLGDETHPNDTYNLFYVFGPGFYSRAEAVALLRDAPATDTASITPPPSRADGGMLPVLGLALVSMLALLRWRDRGHATSGQGVSVGGPG